MAKVNFTPALCKEYEDLFNNCIIKPGKMTEVEAIIGKLLAKRDVYRSIGTSLGIPRHFIAVVHNLAGDVRE